VRLWVLDREDRVGAVRLSFLELLLLSSEGPGGGLAWGSYLVLAHSSGDFQFLGDIFVC